MERILVGSFCYNHQEEKLQEKKKKKKAGRHHFSSRRIGKFKYVPPKKTLKALHSFNLKSNVTKAFGCAAKD